MTTETWQERGARRAREAATRRAIAEAEREERLQPPSRGPEDLTARDLVDSVFEDPARSDREQVLAARLDRALQLLADGPADCARVLHALDGSDE